MLTEEESSLNYITTPRDILVDFLARRDGDLCYMCDCEFDNVQDSKRSRTIDHVNSIDWCRRQGWTADETHGAENLKLACKACNSQKSNREWLEDGTLAPRGRERVVKAPRPEVCETCMSGRLLLIGETCPICQSGPQPATAPKMYQKTPKECSHKGLDHCWMCYLGFLPRNDDIIVTQEAE